MLESMHGEDGQTREYVRSLMEQHGMKRSDAVILGVGEIVLVVGEQKNRGIWMKRKVLRHIKGRDGIIWGSAVLLHKGHEIERPLELLCPLEIRSAEAGERVMSQSIPTGYIPPGNPGGFAQKNCPGGRDLTFEGFPGAGNSTRAGILWKVQNMLMPYKCVLRRQFVFLVFNNFNF